MPPAATRRDGARNQDQSVLRRQQTERRRQSVRAQTDQQQAEQRHRRASRRPVPPAPSLRQAGDGRQQQHGAPAQDTRALPRSAAAPRCSMRAIASGSATPLRAKARSAIATDTSPSNMAANTACSAQSRTAVSIRRATQQPDRQQQAAAPAAPSHAVPMSANRNTTASRPSSTATPSICAARTSPMRPSRRMQHRQRGGEQQRPGQPADDADRPGDRPCAGPSHAERQEHRADQVEPDQQPQRSGGLDQRQIAAAEVLAPAPRGASHRSVPPAVSRQARGRRRSASPRRSPSASRRSGRDRGCPRAARARTAPAAAPAPPGSRAASSGWPPCRPMPCPASIAASASEAARRRQQPGDHQQIGERGEGHAESEGRHQAGGDGGGSGAGHRCVDGHVGRALGQHGLLAEQPDQIPPRLQQRRTGAAGEPRLHPAMKPIRVGAVASISATCSTCAAIATGSSRCHQPDEATPPAQRASRPSILTTRQRGPSRTRRHATRAASRQRPMRSRSQQSPAAGPERAAAPR